jgi:ABC-type sulfate transport system substrate-binding protein
MSEAKIEERAGKIAQLRAFADFLEAHPEARRIYSPAVYDVVHSRAEMAARIKALGGKWDKDEDGESFKVRQTIAGVQYVIFAAREDVCTRVVTGTKEVLRTEADPDAVAALPKRTYTETVEDVQWVCPESLLAGVAA